MTRPVRVLTLLPLLGHPRDSKRIAMLQQQGFSVEVAAFERRYHKGRMPDCPVTILGRIEHGRYVRRAFRMLRAFPRLRRKMKEADLIYASGPDLGLMAQVAGVFLRKPVVIEIGDIREVQTAKGVTGVVARFVDRLVSRAASLLVVTTEGFARDYYGKWLDVDTPVLVIENKLEPGIPSVNEAARMTPGHSLTIGYFGMLRCKRSWETLEKLARERPDIHLVVGGAVFAPADLVGRLKQLPNARWVGEYKSPGDLPALYGQVDMIWASPFPGPDEQNWHWARSNRFYESCHFRRPPIVFLDSGDGKAVRKYRIGLEVGVGDVEADVDLVASLTDDDIARWRANMDALDPAIYTYTNEAEQLCDAIRTHVVPSVKDL